MMTMHTVHEPVLVQGTAVRRVLRAGRLGLVTVPLLAAWLVMAAIHDTGRWLRRRAGRAQRLALEAADVRRGA